MYCPILIWNVVRINGDGTYEIIEGGLSYPNALRGMETNKNSQVMSDTQLTLFKNSLKN